MHTAALVVEIVSPGSAMYVQRAMALGYEICKRDPNTPADDLLYEVRSTLNRVAGVAASLYR